MGFWDRFLNYARGGPEAIDGWPAPIPIEEFNRALARTLGAALVENGFEAVAPRRWVQSSCAPIRDLLEVRALKGVSYAPMWGFSLDFELAEYIRASDVAPETAKTLEELLQQAMR